MQLATFVFIPDILHLDYGRRDRHGSLFVFHFSNRDQHGSNRGQGKSQDMFECPKRAPRCITPLNLAGRYYTI